MIITGQTESQVFLSRTKILKSGWRNGQIKQWLDPPDQEFFADGSIVKLYDAARVEAVGGLRKQNKPSDREERAMCRIAEKKRKGPAKEKTENAFLPIELAKLKYPDSHPKQFPKGHPKYPITRFVKRWEPDWMWDRSEPIPIKPKHKRTVLIPPHRRGTKQKRAVAEQLRARK